MAVLKQEKENEEEKAKSSWGELWDKCDKEFEKDSAEAKSRGFKVVQQ